MDLTELLMGLETATGIQVWQDICEDEEALTYITYTYQDERPILCGDNGVIADMCEIYVNLYAPMSYDYFEKKGLIRDYLEGQGFVITSTGTHIDKYGPVKVRRVTFDCRYAEERKTNK